MRTLLILWIALVIAAVIGAHFGLILRAPGLLFIPIILVWRTVAAFIGSK